MSSEEENQATLEAGAKEVVHCPFCGKNFLPMALNRKIICPEEGGCGKAFVVYLK